MSSQPQPPPSSQPKIFIAATPKTGNVWLKNLLATAYSLRVIEIGDTLNEKALVEMGDGWIAHQHISPTRPLLELLKRHGVIVLTVLRHPCDVLVSLKSYLRKLDDATDRERHASNMLADGDSFGEQTLQYVNTEFAPQVNLSLLWWKVGAIPVRYEELLENAAGVLRSLEPKIAPLTNSRIRSAVALSDINRLRARNKKMSFHFRSGKSGGWRDVLPPEVVEVFRNTPPYPAQFQALGYSLDAPPPAETQPATPNEDEVDNPFKGAAEFDNGAAISDFLILVYFDTVEEHPGRWPDPTRTEGPDSYFSWLQAPCESDPLRDNPPINLTNLAYAFYLKRPDLQRHFPDVFGADRLGFANWFLLCARSEYDLDIRLVAPTLESIARAEAIDVGL